MLFVSLISNSQRYTIQYVKAASNSTSTDSNASNSTTDPNPSDVKNIKDDIQSITKDIKNEQQNIDKYSTDLQGIQTNIYQSVNQINATQTEIDKTEEGMSRMELEIKSIEERMNLQKELLGYYLQDLYYINDEGIPEFFLTGTSLTDVFSNADNLETVGDKINQINQELGQEKTSYEDEKSKLEATKQDHDDLLKLREDQYYSLKAQQSSKQTQLSQSQSKMDELQAKLNKMQSELAGLLGKSINTDDIKKAVSFAAGATGVRYDFLMGMLVIESDLGRYTGGCTYTQSRMSGSRASIFKDICSGLNYNYKKQKVSCPPKSYAGTGGAMGVAQFMPDTWKSYESAIASATGHHPPDPWSLVDGVTAMATKLSKVSGVTNHKKASECNAAKLYLSGTTSSKYDWYCNKVLYWADNWEEKL